MFKWFSSLALACVVALGFSGDAKAGGHVAVARVGVGFGRPVGFGHHVGGFGFGHRVGFGYGGVGFGGFGYGGFGGYGYPVGVAAYTHVAVPVALAPVAAPVCTMAAPVAA